MYLNHEQLETAVSLTPLVSIDLIILNQANEVLLGQRNNRPAKGYWFVPGGRILKNETFDRAFARISQSELGQALNIDNATFLGAYQHLYPDSRFGEHLSTHYVALGYMIKLPEGVNLEIADSQHAGIKWMNFDDLLDDPEVHDRTKDYLPAVKDRL